MSTTIPLDGHQLILERALKASDHIIGLFTNNSSLNTLKTLAYADLTQPTGGGYAEKTLTAADWVWNAGSHSLSYARQTWVATDTPFSAAIYGWFIAKASTHELIEIGKLDDSPSGLVLNVGSTFSHAPRFSLI